VGSPPSWAIAHAQICAAVVSRCLLVMPQAVIQELVQLTGLVIDRKRAERQATLPVFLGRRVGQHDHTSARCQGYKLRQDPEAGSDLEKEIQYRKFPLVRKLVEPSDRMCLGFGRSYDVSVADRVDGLTNGIAQR